MAKEKAMEVSEQLVDLILHKMHRHGFHMPKQSRSEGVSERVAEKLAWVLHGMDKALPFTADLGVCCVLGLCMDTTEENCNSLSNSQWEGTSESCANYQCP
jgi:hypothetical protein